MKIRLTGALALAVLAISAPLASASLGDDLNEAPRGALGVDTICHFIEVPTELDTDLGVVITVSDNALPAHSNRVLHEDVLFEDGSINCVSPRPAFEVIIGPPGDSK